jgi:hypothetical protein
MFDEYLDFIGKRLCDACESDPNFLQDIECKDNHSYKKHLEIMYKLLRRWGLAGDGAENDPLISALVAFHGIDAENLPETLREDAGYLAIHQELRRLIQQHDGIVRQGPKNRPVQELQKDLAQVEERNPLLLAVFLANSMSLLDDATEKDRPAERLRHGAHFYLEVLAEKALERGAFTDSREYADRAMRHLNPDSYHQIRDRLAELKVLGNQLSTEVAQRLRKRGMPDVPCYFRTRYASALARELGVLFEDDPGVVETCQVADAGRVFLDLPDEAAAFTVLGHLALAFPERNYRVKDFLSHPKASGYRGLHARLPVWIRQDADEPILSDEADGFAEKAYIKFALLMPEGSRLLREGDQQVRWLGPEENEVLTHITVFTRDDKPFRMPRGATLLDFAFRVHTEIGLRCVGGDVRKRSESVKTCLKKEAAYELRADDKIDIATSDTAEPTPLWLKSCRTPNARTKIRRYLRSKRAVEKFKYLVNINFTAYDGRGLAYAIAKELSDRGLYASYFRGKTLWDGAASFDIELLMTPGEMDHFIRRKELLNTLERHEDVLSIQSVHEASYSRMGQLSHVHLPPQDWDANPVSLTFFVGRKVEIGQLVNWFTSQETPCMAISGFFRAGKTTLSAQFARQFADTIPLYINCSNMGPIRDETDFYREILRQLDERLRTQDDIRLDRVEVDEASASREGIAIILDRIAQRSARIRKRNLLIFDDVDVLETVPVAPMLETLIDLSRFLNDALQFKRGYVKSPRFLIVGQYRLYRHLKFNKRASGIPHLPLRRVIHRDFCRDYVRKRFTFHHANNPRFKSLLGHVDNLVSWVGQSPQDLSNFVDLLFGKIVQAEPPPERNTHEFIGETIETLYYQILNDPNLQIELFEQIAAHYLGGGNETVAQILDVLTGSPEKSLRQSALENRLGAAPRLAERIDELVDFGFIERRERVLETGKTEIWLNLFRNLTTDFLCGHFGYPPFRKRRDD